MSEKTGIDATAQDGDFPFVPTGTEHDRKDLRRAAERGFAATDRYGVSLVEFDKEAERRLRNKLDLMVVPTVSILYLFRFIDRANIAFRLSLFIVMAPLAGAFGGLLASGILGLPNFASLHQWRMIFAIEGIITIGLSLLSFTLTDRPETARWLSQEEKDLAIARVKSERIAQASVLDSIDRKKLWLGFFNPVVLSTAAVFLLNNITVQGLAFFTPTIVGTIYPAYSTVQEAAVHGAAVFIVMTAPLVMVGYVVLLATTNPRARYAATFLNASSCFAVGALANAQASAQVVSDTSRTISLSTNMMFGNIGGLIATWSYLSWDGPNYPIGNGLNLAASSLILIISPVTLLWMTRDNKKREQRDVDDALQGLAQSQIESLEWKHPAFRWKP
ncbi:hypothetical protein DL764_004321 [Monosporascus ibericus]|uniref:Major facilitator superfamily (MFS) profile domain-containing protein n=1 Tax=Monosporascus ibericus TaxID=155417 RepID=A0A4V1XB14_9PEZI|nr:hypothetical protein DL764_004321 [Monosporascus ibericus]